MSTDAERRRRFERVAAEVFEPLQRYLRRRASASDAADAFGDTLLVIWRRLDDVPTDDPLPWSYCVARRCLANQRRGADRHLRLVERAAAVDRPRIDDDPTATADGGDERLQAALEHLSASEAEIVRLWAWEQLEPAEIAAVLEMSPNAVSVALSRSKRKLRTELLSDERQDASPSGQEPDTTEDHTGRSER